MNREEFSERLTDLIVAWIPELTPDELLAIESIQLEFEEKLIDFLRGAL